MNFIPIPAALQGCDHAALHEYVQASILSFTSHPAFASSLGLTPDVVKHATLNLLQQQQQPLAAFALPPLQTSLPTPEIASPLLQQQHTTPPTELRLVFRHDCLNLGCADFRCHLCTSAQARRCFKNFCPKYLVGDAIKAECGAPVRVEILDKSTGQPLSLPQHSSTALHGVKLDVVLLNGKSVHLMKESTGGHITPRDLEKAALTKHSGKYLLDRVLSLEEETLEDEATIPGEGEIAGAAVVVAGGSGQNITTISSDTHTPEGRAILQFRNNQANLSELMVTGSSEGILSGQRPQFILLVRAVHAETNIPLPNVPPLLSDGFVVATARVRTAIKKRIPHLNDHVSKLNSVGKATVEKLKDLRQAATDGGCSELELPLAHVHTVAEFRQLVDWASDKYILGKLKGILKLATGWETAREHAAMAVADDFCLRAWWMPPENGATNNNRRCALVYAAEKGLPLLSQGPIALLEFSSPSSSFAGNQADRTAAAGANVPLGGAVLRPILKETSPGEVCWALDSIITSEDASRSFFSSVSIPSSIREAAPPYPSQNTIQAAHNAWFQPQHPGWIRFPLPLTAEFLRGHLMNVSQPQQAQQQQANLVLSSRLMAMCSTYYGQGVGILQETAVQMSQANGPIPNAPVPQRQQQQQQQQQPPAPPLPPLPPPEPSAAPTGEYVPPLLQSFPSIPHPELLSRLISSLPSFDSDQAAAAAATAAAAGGASAGGGSDALFPAFGGSGNSSSLFRGLTPDWGKINSLSPQEWQQLMQLADLPPIDLPPSRPPSNAAAAVAAAVAEISPLKPLSRSVSAAKSTFSGKVIDKTSEPSPFNTVSPSQTPLPPLPPLPPPPRQQQQQQQQQQEMLGEEPSLKLMLSVEEMSSAGQVLASTKKRHTDDIETLMDGATEKDDTSEKDEEEKGKRPKQRRLSLPY